MTGAEAEKLAHEHSLMVLRSEDRRGRSRPVRQGLRQPGIRDQALSRPDVARQKERSMTEVYESLRQARSALCADRDVDGGDAGRAGEAAPGVLDPGPPTCP